MRLTPVLCALLLCGCGTIDTFIERDAAPFGGVARDANLGGRCARSNDLRMMAVPLFVLDLPLSFVADVATLPVAAFVSQRCR
jgi:uncharacterized protein YceK